MSPNHSGVCTHRVRQSRWHAATKNGVSVTRYEAVVLIHLKNSILIHLLDVVSSLGITLRMSRDSFGHQLALGARTFLRAGSLLEMKHTILALQALPLSATADTVGPLSTITGISGTS